MTEEYHLKSKIPEYKNDTGVWKSLQVVTFQNQQKSKFATLTTISMLLTQNSIKQS